MVVLSFIQTWWWLSLTLISYDGIFCLRLVLLEMWHLQRISRTWFDMSQAGCYAQLQIEHRSFPWGICQTLKRISDALEHSPFLLGHCALCSDCYIFSIFINVKIAYKFWFSFKYLHEPSFICAISDAIRTLDLSTLINVSKCFLCPVLSPLWRDSCAKR